MGRGALKLILCLFLMVAIPLEAGFFSSKPACPDIFNTVSEGYYFRTERLELAPVEKSDFGKAVAIMMHPQVVQMNGQKFPETVYWKTFQGSQPHIPTKASELNYVNFGIKDQERKLVGVVQLLGGAQSTNYFKGVGVSPAPGNHAVIGYHLDPSAWGAGVATEASARVIAYTFDHLNLDGIYTSVMAANVRSIRVLEKSGFQKVGESGDGDALQYHYFLAREAYANSKK